VSVIFISAFPCIFTDLVDRDIQVLKTYGAAPYAAALKNLEKQIKEKQQSVNEKIGVKVLYVKSILMVLCFC